MNPRFHPVMPIAPRPEVVFSEGRGSRLWDETGRQWLDFVQGWAVNTLGHGHPAIVEAIQSQAAKLINPSPAFYNGPMIELARLLTEHSTLDRVFFANSGAEANEGAIKLARKWGAIHKGGAHKIISFENGFHGRTLATMSASGKAGWDTLFAPKVPGFIKVPFNDLAAVSMAMDDQTVAVMLEPIQGEAGVIPATPGFMKGLRALTRERGSLLILDEVQTGMGRTGALFAHQGYGIEPDIMTLGKGIGGGVPLAALLATEAASCFDYGDQGGTYNGNPLTTAVGVAVLETLLSEGFLERVEAAGAHLRRRLEGLALGGVRGQGLLLAVDSGDRNATELAQAAFEAGLLINAPRPNTLRLMPALTVSDGEIDEMAEILATLL